MIIDELQKRNKTAKAGRLTAFLEKQKTDKEAKIQKQKKQNSVDRYFIAIVKREVSEEEFSLWIAEAKSLIIDKDLKQ